MRWSVLVLLAVLSAAPALAQTPAVGSWREALGRLRAAPVVRPFPRAARSAANLATIIGESEPNNSAVTADSVALGDRARGAVDPAGDVDTWFVDLVAGDFLSVDVDAAQIGSALDATIVLLAPDGLTQLAFNDDFDEFDSRISFHIPTSGRYYVAIRAFGDAGGPQLRYEIAFDTVTCAAVGTEQEPNDTPGTAAPIAIGDSGSGELCADDANPAGDVDYWVFTGQAGTTIELEADAAPSILHDDPAITLYASDGVTQLAFGDDAAGQGSRLQFSIIETGTYFAAVATLVDPGGNPFPYTLHLRSIIPGPGDPIVVHAQALGLPLGLAVGRTGDLFVGDLAGDQIVRVSAQGGVTSFATGIPTPVGLAFDAFGNLLVVSPGDAVYRVTPQGEATRLITDADFPFWIAVASDGRIWLTDVSSRTLRRYSSTGQLEERFDATAIGGSGPGPLAISPSGEPYVSNGTEIWRLVNGQFQRVLTDGAVIWGFAFDVAGNIYASSPTTGRIKLFGPTGTVLADAFAVGPDAPQAVAFGRDRTGATLARLFATDTRTGRLIEMNPAGVEHAGFPVGFSALAVDVAAASLLGAGVLSLSDVQFLDDLGNHNGRYDVGDLQAYLRTLGRLPGTARLATPGRPGSDR